jgi:Lar family restriction alleviation protein
MAELKPCPFCGGKAKAEKEFLGTWKIKCTKCSCDVGRYWFHTKAQAVIAWNTRTPEERGGEK